MMHLSKKERWGDEKEMDERYGLKVEEVESAFLSREGPAELSNALPQTNQTSLWNDAAWSHARAPVVFIKGGKTSWQRQEANRQ